MTPCQCTCVWEKRLSVSVLYAALLILSEHIHRFKQTFLVVSLVNLINTDN